MLLVLAGGFGTRLKSAVPIVPKVLAPVGHIPFMQLQIEHWKDQGISSFTFLLHYQAAMVIDFLQNEKAASLKDCEVKWLVEPAPMGTGGALAFAVEQLNLSGDFLVTNADTWLGTGMMEVRQANSPALAVLQLTDTVRYGQVQLDNQNHVTAFDEKSGNAGGGWINAGLCHLNAELFKDWNHMPFSLERTILPVLASSGNLIAVPLQADFIDIGIPDDYSRFCRWIKSDKKIAL
jgi:D-glycero-alpha-D-manno-heptose 1-phosphate guanylyltransferase